MKASLRSLLLGGASVLSACSLFSAVALAQTDTVNGGGSSLAAKVYNTVGFLYGQNSSNFVLNYGTSSSGTGTTALINNSDCTNYAGSTGPGSLGCPATTDDFAASDAYLSASNFTALQTAFGVNPVQIPMFATPVTVAFNIPGFTTDGSVAFTDNDLGLIFSGQVTNLNSPLLSQNSSTTLTHLPNQAITVVYRSDGSGTSNLFTTHLANVLTPTAGPCTTGTPTQGQFYNANFAQGPAYPFNTTPASTASVSTAIVPSLPVTGNNTFSLVFTGSGGCGMPAGATFSGQSGSGGVQSKILATAGAIGYLSPDYTDIAPNNGNGVPTSPVTFPPVASVNGVLPTYQNTGTAIGTPSAPTTAAQAANQENYAPLVPNPGVGYPIVGYTYWFLDQCYATTSPYNQASDINSFLVSYFTSSVYSTIVQGNGFSPISGTTGLGKAILNNLVTNKLGANANIGNASVCTAGRGR